MSRLKALPTFFGPLCPRRKKKWLICVFFLIVSCEACRKAPSTARCQPPGKCVRPMPLIVLKLFRAHMLGGRLRPEPLGRGVGWRVLFSRVRAMWISAGRDSEKNSFFICPAFTCPVPSACAVNSVGAGQISQKLGRRARSAKGLFLGLSEQP